MGTTTNLRKRTIRRNGKWAKLDRNQDGSWIAALGWYGDLKAVRVVSYPKPLRYGAQIAADSWLDDNG